MQNIMIKPVSNGYMVVNKVFGEEPSETSTAVFTSTDIENNEIVDMFYHIIELLDVGGSKHDVSRLVVANVSQESRHKILDIIHEDNG